MQVTTNNKASLDAYVPRVVRRRLATAPGDAVQTAEGTAVFTDVSGFTRLSERLARSGTEGAELLVDTINTCFSTLLADAYANGGSLLKFGGDALLLWFEGADHAPRACASAHAMRQTLRRVGRLRAGTTEVILRMSIGVHSGAYEMFLVGGSHHEFLIAGPSASAVVALEAAASTGQILLSPVTARHLPASCLGAGRGPGILLARAPSVEHWEPEDDPAPPDDAAVATCLSTGLRKHLAAGAVVPEHRMAAVSFLQFGGLDGLIAGHGPAAAAEAVDGVVRAAQEACDRYEVCFLASDIALDGGKLLFSAGAPRAVGDDEERMLLAMRQVVEARPPLPVRVGVTRGSAFAGEVGPSYRRTYVVMGDVVNLAARLMAKAGEGQLYATPEVLERSHTRFHVSALEPFLVKGKARPIMALAVGPAAKSSAPSSVRRRLPLIGRQREQALLSSAIASAQRGSGQLIEIVGETGSGKSRLLSEARELAAGMRFFHAASEPYSRDTPYAAWRDVLRQLLGLTWEDDDEAVVAKLRGELEGNHPELLPWTALLAIPLDVDAGSTPEIEELASDARAGKLHEVVLRFLSRALVVPTLVEFEHAHLMDAASGALLVALARELDSSAWVVIATRRDVPGGLELADAPHERIELGPLTPEDLLDLAQTAGETAELPPHVVELAAKRSGGSPEFLLDLLAAAAAGDADALPDSVGAAAMARIDALEPPDRVLLRHASVLGLAFHPERLVDVLPPQTPAPAEADWQRLAGVFALDPDGHIRFKRPAIQEAAYASLPFKLRRTLHAAVAERLERDRAEDPDADPAVLSMHFLRAGDYARAQRYALIGAERATTRFSHADAASLYRRAIEAAHAAGGSRDGGALAYAWEQLGEALRCTGEPASAAYALRQARRLVGDDPIAQARLYYRHAEVADVRESLSAAVRWLRRGLRCVETSETPDAVIWRARLHSFLGGVRNRQGRWREAATLCRQAMLEADSVGELEALARACYALDWALVESGHAGEATHSWRALEIYEQLGDPEHESTVLNNLGMFAYYDGRWDDAVAFYRRAGVCSQRAGKPGDVAYTDCNVGEILADQGYLEEAAIHLERARRVWTATKEWQGVAFVNLLLGRLAARAGRYDDAIPLLEVANFDLTRFRIDAYTGFARAISAEAEAFCGDAARGLEIAQEELQAGEGRHLPMLHRVAGIAHARLGRLEEAQGELLAAGEISRRQDAEYELAATLDVMDALGLASDEELDERDGILHGLQVERLPQPRLGALRRRSSVRRRLTVA